MEATRLVASEAGTIADKVDEELGVGTLAGGDFPKMAEEKLSKWWKMGSLYKGNGKK